MEFWNYDDLVKKIIWTNYLFVNEFWDLELTRWGFINKHWKPYEYLSKQDSYPTINDLMSSIALLPEDRKEEVKECFSYMIYCNEETK